jgi:hypothetical protein
VKVFLNDDIISLRSNTDTQEAYVTLIDDTQLELFLPRMTKDGKPQSKYTGLLHLRVGVGDRVSDPVEFVISKIESSWKAAWVAGFITLGLLGLPLLLISSKGTEAYSVAGKSYTGLAAFMIDKETDTYSLSKFQFYVWTAVAIFGYVYLAIIESMVQGKAVFPEIPENLPGIILISAATGALATGITSARGPKGSGGVHPTMADFISAGGLVVSERFQFFIWTMLGAVTFLFFTVTSDPATLHDLPKIPESFLQIMGISSLGYLGGKLARKPGPVIDQIQPEPSIATKINDTLQLTITGQKLSPLPALRIGSDELKVEAPPQSGSAAVPSSSDETRAKLIGSTKEEAGEFCTKLVFAINKPNSDWKTVGKHKVTVTNDDGKAASWDYTIDPETPGQTAQH